jgi:four helix bundle protein
MANLETLDVANHALDLAALAYAATEHFPREERFGLTNQMRRAAVSVGSNIAEGTGRGTKAQLLHFLSIACGSASELEFQSRLARRLGYGREQSLDKLIRYSIEQRRLLIGYAKWVRRQEFGTRSSAVPRSEARSADASSQRAGEARRATSPPEHAAPKAQRAS